MVTAIERRQELISLLIFEFHYLVIHWYAPRLLITAAYFFNGFMCTGYARVARMRCLLDMEAQKRASLVKVTCRMNLVILQSTVMLQPKLLTTLVYYFIGFI